MKGRDLRDAGIARVSIGREDWIAKARRTTISIANRTGKVSINDVRLFLDLPDDCSPNLWGPFLEAKILRQWVTAKPRIHRPTLGLFGFTN